MAEDYDASKEDEKTRGRVRIQVEEMIKAVQSKDTKEQMAGLTWLVQFCVGNQQILNARVSKLEEDVKRLNQMV